MEYGVDSKLHSYPVWDISSESVNSTHSDQGSHSELK